MSHRAKGFTLVELLIVVAIIGILAAIAIPNLMMAIQRARQKKTMVTMRNIATAWEARASDYSKYNAAGGYVGADISIPVTDIEGILSPTYIRTTPTTDGWGRPLSTFLNKALTDPGTATIYAISSPGRDGIYNSAQAPGAFNGFDCDIVYANGTFINYPAPN